MADETMSRYFVTNATHCPAHGFTPHREGECVACAREEKERAVLSAAEEWREADEAMAALDHSLGVSVMLNERIDPEEPRRLAQLKAVEFGKRNALRAAVDELRRARGEAEKGGEGDG